jgi:hypothetical protein
MLIDLVDSIPCITKDFPSMLVLRLAHGDVTQYTFPPVSTRAKPVYIDLNPTHELDGRQIFVLTALSAPYSRSEDVSGWDFCIHKTDEHRRYHQYFTAVLMNTADMWFVRFWDGHHPPGIHIEIPDFNQALVHVPISQIEEVTVWDKINDDHLG